MYNIVYNFAIVSDSTEFVDVPSSEGAASEGARLVEHGPYLLHFVVHNVVSFASIGQVLMVEVTTQHVNIAVVEADAM
jgi:hypothetical protein